VPNKPRPENRNRNVRVEDELWEQVKAFAKLHGMNASEVVREAIRQYLGRRKDQG